MIQLTRDIPQHPRYLDRSCLGKKLDIAILIILALSSLIVLAIGTATVGGHQGWWNAGELIQLSEAHTIVLLSVGGGTLFVTTLTKVIIEIMRNTPYLRAKFWELERIAKESVKDYPKLTAEEINDLGSWLDRILGILRGKSDQHKLPFAKKIQDYIQLAASNPQFCDSFMATIKEAATTCGDKVALSLIRVDLMYQLEKVDHQNLRQLAEFLKKKIWTMDMLQKIASDHFKTYNRVVTTLDGDRDSIDLVSVYLGFPMALRDRLGLEFDISDIQFQKLAQIQDSHLSKAERLVKTAWSDDEQFQTFLIKNDVWMKALAKHFPDCFEAMQVTLNDFEGDFNQLEIERDHQYRTMTQRALNGQ